ncbi:hypothetical protein L596_000028 [Steinernema carpocapsae]|uniref:Sterol regulatory element-binding protein cleavage-activating protein n=1 Tax=Steinernema carpocapsae TaxID=34508 RepID=A0A4U8UJC7_STECR|nr:hypothetical protein L596_000028 [Steinernema carpocapsae]
MLVSRVDKYSRSLRERVSQAYYDYGRLCSAHPAACLTISLITMILLMYPALNRCQLPISSPMDVHWSEQHKVEHKDGTIPDWLYLEPSVYFQQIIVEATVEPWNSFNMTPVLAVKGALSRAFIIEDILKQQNAELLAQHCLRGALTQTKSENDLLPQEGCMLFSPTAFWDKDITKFYKDGNILQTLFNPSCSSSMCVRDILLGTPTRSTGIKSFYQTNRNRRIDYALTLILSKYNKNFTSALKNTLSDQFEIRKSKASDESTFVHVFYRPRKYFADYFPLFISYLALVIYIYYSASKFVMVKSRWGLSLAAVITVSSTLVMTGGICSYFELTPTLWGAEWYPYLALLVGLENTLCITRSVVYTPPTLDVKSRLSHGLSQEGYSLTKYFLMEICFLFAGYTTFVPEIQEFCTFAFIGLFVDFYMQMFFYAPCLTFDLIRLARIDKLKISKMVSMGPITQLHEYRNITCPVKRLFPSFFRERPELVRSHSDSNLNREEPVKTKLHRRTNSSVKYKDNVKASEISTRLRLLYYWTRTRFIQRVVMIVFVLWTIWLGFIVHHWRLYEIINASDDIASVPNEFGKMDKIQSAERFGVSHRLLETAPLQWGDWQKKTFKWWPTVFGEYNMSLSGHYITFLPPVVLKSKIPATDASVAYSSSAQVDNSVGLGFVGFEDLSARTTTEKAELTNRIFWVEQQITVIMACSAVCLFATVVIFILYVCFWGKWPVDRILSEVENDRANAQKEYARDFVESVSLVFSHHNFPIETVCLAGSGTIISTCQEGQVNVWDASNGEKLRVVNRTKVIDGSGEQPTAMMRTNAENPPLIWCSDAKQTIAVFGCADGSLEICNYEFGILIGFREVCDSGIVYVRVRGNRIVICRLNGTIEFLECNLTPDHPVLMKRLKCIWVGRAHQKAITCLKLGTLTVITASRDHTVKVFDIRTACLLFTLQGHDAPVTSIMLDDKDNILFTSCEQGIICCWNLDDGSMKNSIESSFGSKESVELACTDSILVGFTTNGQLWLWDKPTGAAITRITPEPAREQLSRLTMMENADCVNSMFYKRRCIVTVHNDLVATSADGLVQFWDLSYKIMIKQVSLPGEVDRLISIDSGSVICSCLNNLYRITVPVIRLK